jgi:U3 small nucleolar RNA-associated protein 20
MIENRGFHGGTDKDGCKLPQGWQDQIVSKFERLEIAPFPERGPYDKDPQVWRDKCLPKYSALLRLLEIAWVHPSTNARVAELLLRKLKLALRPSSSIESDEVHFIVSQGFHAYLRMSQAAGDVDPGLLPLLRAALPRFARSIGFLQAYLAYERSLPQSQPLENQSRSSSESSTVEDDKVETALVENLSSSSHEMRLASLEILQHNAENDESKEVLSTMLYAENTPLSHAETRNLAMTLRRLAKQHGSLSSGASMKSAIPRFLFGMLTVQMAPVWDEAVGALEIIAQDKDGEEAMSALAFEWLAAPSMRYKISGPGNSHSDKRRVVTEFDCTNVLRLEAAAEKVQAMVVEPEEQMLQFFDDRQQTAQPIPETARSRALKVFDAIPLSAERRSRQLSPYFLSWAHDEDTSPDTEQDSDQPQEGLTWSLADRKALLSVFSKFVNPRVLYQHEKVYSGLLGLMANGDIEIQKAALKSILAWKQEGVKPYQENLEFLLDEARFKNELTVFLQGENVIKPEHRPELMPVLLRLLYGRSISKKGAASGRHGLHATRLAVLRNLSVEDMGQFLEIATGKLGEAKVIGASAKSGKIYETPLIPLRRQIGFLNMISSFISELGSNVTPYMDTLLNSVLYCLIFASRSLNKQAQDSSSEQDEETEADADQEPSDGLGLLKSIRTVGIKCLVALFQNGQKFQWEAYHEVIMDEIVAPRASKLPQENAQGVSGMLQLLSTWSKLPKAALLLGPQGASLSEGILPKVVEILALEKAKNEVKVHALGMIESLCKLALAPASESEFNDLIQSDVIGPSLPLILPNLSDLLEASSTNTDLLDACVDTMLALAPILRESNNVEPILRNVTFLLQQPPRRVNPRTKGRVLLVLEDFVKLLDMKASAGLWTDMFTATASLFSYFKDRENRQSLSRVMLALAEQDTDIAEVSELCVKLNSYAERRLDEPDYDQRLEAYNAISHERDMRFSPKQWLPLLHNAIFFLRVDEEFGILATNAADVIRQLIKATSSSQDSDEKAILEGYLRDVLLPALYSGARESSETVRREHLRVFSMLLTIMPNWGSIADLVALQPDQSEEGTEPPFFFNILSPAVSRQLEALRSLETANLTHEMGSQNLTQFFLPLLEHFIYGRESGSDDHGLGAQAVDTIGKLAMSLDWKHYRTTLGRYISYIGSRQEFQKQTMRLLGKVTDALVASAPQNEDDAMEVDEPAVKQRLAATLPGQGKLNTDIAEMVLPPLMKHLHEKDESEVSFRVPVGVVIVNLMRILPEEQMSQRLAGVLTDICHILRSKSVESRDLARDTLVKISVILGPTYFGFILKELRSSLKRGYELHVLSYTMHSIMLATLPQVKPGGLDYCLPNIVMIIMDDIFGVVGQEKDAEGYTTQTKEIKSSKSQDSMELAAKTASINRLIDLIRPLQAMLMQKVDLKMVRKIEILLDRITAGLVQNPAAESRDTLVFCYEIIKEVHQSQRPQAEQKIDPRVKKYLLQKGAKKNDRGTTTKHTYKIVRFAFDILRSVFKKYDSLRTTANIVGLIPIIGDAIIGNEDEVKMSAFRLLGVIVKVPFTPEEEGGVYKVAVREATKSLSNSTSTTTDLSQAALKMLAVVLRDKKDVVIRDAAVDVLLGKLKDDLTEPLYRHVTFNFLRAVLDRRVETATVYDTMDHVGTVMITNDDKDTRDLARGAFFQFIREYPQTKARWTKQLDFVVANLKYKREGGRLSVMEMIHLLLRKSSEEFVQEVVGMCFIPLFMVLANDDSEKCRLAAGQLLKEMFAAADKQQTRKFLALLRSWLSKDDNPAILTITLVVFDYYFESSGDASKNTKDYKLVLDQVKKIIESEPIEDVDAQLLLRAIGLIRTMMQIFPDEVLSQAGLPLLENGARCLKHKDPAVKLAAMQLITAFLGDFAKEGSRKSSGTVLMTGAHGLELDLDRVSTLVRVALGVLNSQDIEEPLAAEAGQALIFLAPRLPDGEAATEEAEEDADADADVEGEEDEAEKQNARQMNLQKVFTKLSTILRKEISPRSIAINGKTTAMEVFETICRRASIDRLRPAFKTILTPLQNLTDPSIRPPYSLDEVFKTKHEALKTRAQIMMDAMQKKFGTADYSRQLLEIREEVRERRQQRSSKRKIEAIAQPEKYGRDKRKKFEREKERRKIRGKEQKAMRQAYKGW